MTGRVFNALGGTKADLCPTALAKWAGTGYCNAGDYRAWYFAAANMYEHGILPTHKKLQSLDGSDVAIDERVQGYARDYEQLPPKMGIWPSKNFDGSLRVSALMDRGDLLIDDMQARIAAAGADAPAIARKPPEKADLPRLKPWWQKWLLPAGIAIGGLAVGGTVLYATRDRGKE